MKAADVKKLLVIFCSVIILVSLGYLGYYYYQSNVKSRANEKNQQKLSDLYSHYQTTSAAVYDLKNDWNLYESQQYGFSLEYPAKWLFEEDNEATGTFAYGIFFENLDPKTFPKSKGVIPETPENYLQFNLIIRQGDTYKSEYDNLQSDDPNDSTVKILPTEVLVNGMKAKKVYSYYNVDAVSGYVVYYIPTTDFSKIYVLSMTDKEPAKVSEFEQMLNTFKILDY